jgi:DNA-directed RNA polymerase subunit L
MAMSHNQLAKEMIRRDNMATATCRIESILSGMKEIQVFAENNPIAEVILDQLEEIDEKVWDLIEQIEETI